MKKNLLILMLGVFLCYSCLDDTGNYSYSELTPIEIDSSGMLAAYRVTQADYLVIDPQVKQGVDDSNLAYEWRIFQGSPQPNEETGKVVDDVVGKKRKLNYKVETPIGNYSLSLKVFDKSNGVFETIVRPLTVESFAPAGMMVMHGDADSCDVSILVNNRIISDASKDEVLHNVFSTTNGHRVDGAPGMVGFTWNGPRVYVGTHGGKGGCLAKASNLGFVCDYAEMFEETLGGTNIDFQSCQTNGADWWMVNAGKVHYVQGGMPSFIQFGIAAWGESYYAEPYIATLAARGYSRGVFYDRIGRRFLWCDASMMVQKFKPAGATAAFDMGNVGKDMVYAEHGVDKKYYCVMRDPDSQTAYSLYECDLSAQDDGNRGIGKYDLSGCEGLADARGYTFGKHNKLFFYASDTEIKLCNFGSGNTSETVYTLPAELVDAGYKISMINLFAVYLGGSITSESGKNLYIGVYNESSEDGKLLECPIVVTSGAILADQVKTYDGFKKITHLSYKNQ